VNRIWRFLRTTYWPPKRGTGRRRAGDRASLVFGIYSPTRDQAGFAPVVMDRAGFPGLAEPSDSRVIRGVLSAVRFVFGNATRMGSTSASPSSQPIRAA
jgi:hypothetical protein